MASGFKQATVNASDVPATLTNYPAYVALSRLGITTLAEAQSVRCYSDSAKTTELAREIVSVTEMHVKVSSLTSTFVLYVDWDGARADYAATDTYGRNAVWSDYAFVFHFENSLTNSVGNLGGLKPFSLAILLISVFLSSDRTTPLSQCPPRFFIVSLRDSLIFFFCSSVIDSVHHDSWYEGGGASTNSCPRSPETRLIGLIIVFSGNPVS